MFSASSRRVLRTIHPFMVGVTIYSLFLSSAVPMAMANPAGGTVVAGSATIQSSGNTLTVTQNSSRAVVNWQGFSIGAGELTQFVQPSANAAILNRVTGGDPSAIMGAMQSNGQVYLINPSGIVFGPNAAVHTGGLIVSTLDVSNGQFMRGGDLTFSGDSTAGIYNYGELKAIEGDIYLIASNVANHGVIQASQGSAGLIAGQSVTLVDGARPHLPVTANGKSLSETGVTNTGLIDAVKVELAANGGNVYALAINNSGTVRATGSVERNGHIYLTSPGNKIVNTGDLVAKSGAAGGKVTIDAGASGVAQVSGTIDVSGTRGGEVQVTGDHVALASATIDASASDADGGVVLIGGDYKGANPDVHNAKTTVVSADSHIDVDAGARGNGGVAIVWADGKTDFSGTITGRGGEQSGNGGFAEVSGKQELFFDGLVNLSAPAGDVGLLLLDPVNVTIGTGAGELDPSTIETAVGMNDVVIHTTGDSGGSEAGKIKIKKAIKYNEDNRLSFIAHDEIEVRASVLNRGDGTLNFIAGWDGSTGIVGPGPLTEPLANSSEITFFDVDAILDAGAFGATGGNVVISPKNNKGVSIGSQGTDTTNVAGYNVKVHGGSDDGEYAQIGYYKSSKPFDPIHNNINVYAKNNVTVKDGNGEGSYAVIGNGGPGFYSAALGKIRVFADRDVKVEASEEYGVAQIGNWAPLALGKIRVDAGRDIEVLAQSEDSVAIVGHRFDNRYHGYDHDHDDWIEGLPSIAVLAGRVKATAGRDIIVKAEAEYSLAAIGHYGRIAERGGYPCECDFDIDFAPEFDGFAEIYGGFDIPLPEGVFLLGNITTHSRENTDVIARDGGTARIGHTGVFRSAADYGGYFPDIDFAPEDIGDLIFGEFDGPGGLGFLGAIGPAVVAVGNIDVTAGKENKSGGNITVKARGFDSTSQIGSFGRLRGEGVVDPEYGSSLFKGVVLLGNITARAHRDGGQGGTINVLAGGANAEDEQVFNHALIGHKGRYDYTTLKHDFYMPRLGFGGEEGGGGLAGAFAIGNISVTADRSVNVGVKSTISSETYQNRAQIGHYVTAKSKGHLIDCDFDFFIEEFDPHGFDEPYLGDPINVADAKALALGDIKVLALKRDVDVVVPEGYSMSQSQIGHEAISSNQKVKWSRGRPRVSWHRSGNAIGDIFIVANRDITLVNGGNYYSEAHIGHGTRHDVFYKTLIGDIVGIAGRNLVLDGRSSHNLAFVGHGDGYFSSHLLKGSILLAWDQVDSKSDNGGRFFMNDHSEVDSGQRVLDLGKYGRYVDNPENLAIFVGTRREGAQPNVIENGAKINGVRYVSFLEDLGDPAGRNLFLQKWGEGVEYESWTAEQWGFELWDIMANPSIQDMLMTCNLDLSFSTLNATYSEPFTFYYLNQSPPPPRHFPPVADWNLFHELPYFPGGVGTGTSSYGEDEINEEDLANDNSNNAFSGDQ